jgi:hypothetical protein
MAHLGQWPSAGDQYSGVTIAAVGSVPLGVRDRKSWEDHYVSAGAPNLIRQRGERAVLRQLFNVSALSEH